MSSSGREESISELLRMLQVNLSPARFAHVLKLFTPFTTLLQTPDEKLRERTRLFRLAPMLRVNSDRLRDILFHITERRVGYVELVSASRPPNPLKLHRKNPRWWNYFWEDIIDGLAGFEDILSQRYGIFVEDLLDEQSRSRLLELVSNVLKNLGDYLMWELFRSQNLTFWPTGDERPEFQDSMEKGLELFERNVTYIWFYYLSFVFAGEMQYAQVLEPLIRTMKHSFPAGKDENKESWIFITQ